MRERADNKRMPAMSEAEVYPVPADWAATAKVDAEAYARDHARSLADADRFWLDQAKRLDWLRAPTVASRSSFEEKDFRISWFEDGVLNVSANCVDRHLASRGDAVAIIW